MGLGAVLVRAGAELRTRWRALVALALVIGLGGGFVIAAATGARRTNSVYARFLKATRAADVEIIDDNSGVTTPIPVEKVEQLPQVAEAARYITNYVELGEGVAFVAPADDKFGVTIDRIMIVSGRTPRAANEAAISINVAQRFHLKLGSELPLYGEGTIQFLQQNSASQEVIRTIRNFHLRVVGIEAGPGELPPQQTGSVGIHVTRALIEFGNQLLPGHPARPSLAVRLKHPGDVGSFTEALHALSGTHFLYSLTQRDLGAGTRRSFHLQAVALWLLAGLVALVSVLIFGQSLARQAALESVDSSTLRALGMSRGQLFGVGMLRAALTAAVGALIAVVVGYLLTPFSPLGLARAVEPHRGFLLDAVTIGLGAAAVLVVVVLLAMVPTWRTSRIADVEEEREQRPSLVAGTLAQTGSPPTVVAGARLAFQRGRGRTAVPVRSSLAGTTIGIAALVAALCFGASLVHLTRSPRLYGWHWDFIATSYGENNYLPFAQRVAAIPGVADYTFGQIGIPLNVDGLSIGAFAVADHRGTAHPPVVEGRVPTAANEIVLGTKALREIHKQVGDTVKVRLTPPDLEVPLRGAKSHLLRVVGRAVFPPVVDPELGRGAMLWYDSFPELPPEFRQVTELVLRFAPGADRAKVIKEVQAALAPAGRPESGGLVFQELPRSTPADILSFGQVRNLPLILAGLLAILAAATLAHTMVSGIHRRARDLALLKTLGFVRGQVRLTVAWQSLFLAAAALLVGVPLGVAAGRWTWTTFADRVGVVPQARVPLLAVLIVVPAALVLANLVGVLPARTAARTQPAMVLRTE